MNRLLVAVLLALVGTVVCKETCDARMYTGYKVDYSLRECVTAVEKACSNPFPYSTLEECRKDFRGRGNICERRRRACRHGGTCMPVSLDNGKRSFQCHCTGTGFYGKHCQHKCRKNTKDQACILA